MLSQYFISATIEEWQKRLESVSSALSAAEEFFSSAWKSESVWQWLAYLEEEMSRFDFTRAVSDKRDAFYLVMLEQINWATIVDLRDKVNEVVDIIENSPRVAVVQMANIESWKALGARLDLDKQGIELMSAKVLGRSDVAQLRINRQLTAVAELYGSFKSQFKLSAAVLLYYSPPSRYQKITDIEKIGEEPVVDWAPVMRLLGEAVQSHDGEAMDWAGKFLYVNATQLDKNIFENEANHLLFVVLLHLSLGNFSELNEWRQARAVEWYAWPALCFGVLIEKELREYLAGRPLLSDYLIHSGGFSELLRYSAQLIRAGGDQTTVGGFIKGFLSFTKGDGRDATEQDLYISQAIAEHKWPADLKYLLQKLLFLYIHLRDCDFVDYRGMLAEEQILLNKYDWKKIIRQDISDKDIEDFREYFKLLDRPALIKTELINAFESVPWGNEPYASRVALLSDLYAEVFPSLDYSPIAYFDEKEGKIKFNKKLPDSWYTPWFRFGVDESVWKEAEEEAKKKFQNLPMTEDLEFD